MTSSGKFGAGLFLGVAIVTVASLLWFPADTGAAPRPTVPTSSAPTSTTAATPWFEPAEVLIDATAILPRSLDNDDGVVVFEYEVAGLSPALVEHEDSEHPGDVLVLPERWVLTTGNGATVEAVTGPQDRSVRFELGGSDDTVATIHLVGWRVATPFRDRVEMLVQPGASSSLRTGELRIIRVLDQANSTIIQLDFEHTGGDWEFGELPDPLDPGWRLAGRDGGFQLIWDEDDEVPEQIVLEDAAFEWRPVGGNILILDVRAAR